MATRTKAKAVKKVKPELKYRPISYSYGDFNGCCGIGILSHFTEKHGDWHHQNWGSGKYVEAKCEFATEKEQALECIKRMDQDPYNSLMMITLVSDYKDGRAPQFPALQEELPKHGWEIMRMFVNANHGNTLTVFCKEYPELQNEDEEDEDWDDEDE